MADSKTEGAFRTIGEVSTELGVPQHILRYWETRFPQLRPLTRAGNRRYYRPDDMALVRRINQALNRDGFTVKGVQKLLSAPSSTTKSTPVAPIVPLPISADLVTDLIQIRDELRLALRD